MSGTDLAALYQSLVLEHNRHPRHAGAIANPSHRAIGANPLCGDRLELGLCLQDDRIDAIGYVIEASALTRAMTSMMAARVYGRPVTEAHEVASAMLADCRPGGVLDGDRVGELAGWQGVLAYPNRIKSLTLPWATLLAALDGSGSASTERA